MNDLSFSSQINLVKGMLSEAIGNRALPHLPPALGGNPALTGRPPAFTPSQGAPMMGPQPPQGLQGQMQASSGPSGVLASYAQPGAQPVQRFAAGGGAWTRKEGKNPEGGLNAKGRASLRAQGHDIKPPVSAKQAKKSPKAAARRRSFCARMSGMPGPMKDDKGRPTRKALSLRKWDCR